MIGNMAPAVEPDQRKLEVALGHKVDTAVFKALCSKYAPTPALDKNHQAGGQPHGSKGEQNGRPNGMHTHRPYSEQNGHSNGVHTHRLNSELTGGANGVHDQSPAGQARTPSHAQALLGVSKDIEGTLEEIREEPEWQEFRDQIQTVVKQTTNVQTMICLGLGNWVPRESFHRANCFVVQYAVFVYMCEKVDEKWRNQCASNGTVYEPVKRYFQDPAFNEQTKYLLQDVPRPNESPINTIIVDLAASKMIKNDKNTFVFAPHLNCNIWPGVLSLDPQVFIGNSPLGFGGRDMAMMETYIQECEITNSDEVGPRFNALLASFKATDTEYDQSELEQGPVDPDHLANLTIYQRSN
ncbi:hypothetical protein E4T50_01387 [Aureobasidium sp. EXF-12298]|nr:hypothetical protein E4T50_01387 [Aureobasidium sp. EXF-12298]